MSDLEELPPMVKIGHWAYALGLHVATIDLWIRRGLIPEPQRYGRRTRLWPRQQLLDFVANKGGVAHAS
jgi:DNA-binding transcriptional MerR regulator